MLIAAFIAAIRYWPKYKFSSQKYFPFFLGYVILHEVFGYICGDVIELENHFIYNIFIIVSFLFYLYWYSLILTYKKLVYVCGLLVIGSIVYSFIVDGLWDRLWDIPLYVGAISILLCSVMYFSSLLQKKEMVHFYKLQPFWIATGLLIFYVGIIPWFFFDDLKYLYLRSYLTSLNVLLYLCFFISFLCVSKK
jgi:hypothetical protein